MAISINTKKLKKNAQLPTHGSEWAAGYDLHACLDESVDIAPGETYFINTGIALEIPVGYAGLIYARSGLSCKQGLAPANKVGVIDADYRGEIIVALYNHSDVTRTVHDGDRIAQLVVTPFLSVEFNETDELSDTIRKDNGFGSSGTN